MSSPLGYLGLLHDPLHLHEGQCRPLACGEALPGQVSNDRTLRQPTLTGYPDRHQQSLFDFVGYEGLAISGNLVAVGRMQ